MNCLYCDRPFSETVGQDELSSGWHASCVRKFFHTDDMPQLDISEEALIRIASENTRRGYTVPGVQKKISLHLTTGREPRLTIVNYPTGFILKPQTAEFQALPEAEYLVMQMAARTGIKTVPFALLQVPGNQGHFAYITRRIDRILPNNRNKTTQMLAMEDFCQLDGRLSQDKYRGSYERCVKIVKKYSMNPGLDSAELFLRIAFSFAIGNSDLHLKNLSLIETEPGSQSYVMSAAYDMIPANIVIQEDKDQLALTLNGKKSNLDRNDFLAFANTCGIAAKSSEKMIEKIASMQSVYLSMCQSSYLPGSMKKTMEELVLERTSLLR